MGDQIYADDVASPIILAIATISRELIGYTEPLAQLDHRLAQEPHSTALSQINGRQFIIETITQYSMEGSTTLSNPRKRLDY